MQFLAASLALLAPQSAWAHGGGAIAPHEVWTHWGAPPIELLLLVLPILWYGYGLRALWRAAGVGHGVSRGQAFAFVSAAVSLMIVLASPLDAMADALFSAHMVQHLIIIVVAAPLWVIGAPVLPGLHALPLRLRKRIATGWLHLPMLRQAWRGLTSPAVVFMVHAVVLWFWHFPAPYEAALRNPAVHALEHFSFFGTALLFWWVVLQPMGARRHAHGSGILLIAATLMQSGALGAVLMFANAPWYPAHGDSAPLWHTTLLADQQLAALIMWVPAGGVYVSAAAWLFLRWMRDDERRLAREDQWTRAPRRLSRLVEDVV